MSALPLTHRGISRAYQICHPRSLLSDDSVANAPACQVGFDHRALPAGSFEPRLSSQTLSPCRWHHCFALTEIWWPSPSWDVVKMKQERRPQGRRGAIPNIFSLSSADLLSPISLPQKLLATSPLCLFVCLFVSCLSPSQEILIRARALVKVFQRLCFCFCMALCSASFRLC